MPNSDEDSVKMNVNDKANNREKNEEKDKLSNEETKNHPSSNYEDNIQETKPDEMLADEGVNSRDKNINSEKVKKNVVQIQNEQMEIKKPESSYTIDEKVDIEDIKEVICYIIETRKQGHKDPNIRQLLLENDWELNQVNESFRFSDEITVIVDYIIEMKKQNIDISQVRKSLSENGWTEIQINLSVKAAEEVLENLPEYSFKKQDVKGMSGDISSNNVTNVKKAVNSTANVKNKSVRTKVNTFNTSYFDDHSSPFGNNTDNEETDYKKIKLVRKKDHSRQILIFFLLLVFVATLIGSLAIFFMANSDETDTDFFGMISDSIKFIFNQEEEVIVDPVDPFYCNINSDIQCSDIKMQLNAECSQSLFPNSLKLNDRTNKIVPSDVEGCLVLTLTNYLGQELEDPSIELKGEVEDTIHCAGESVAESRTNLGIKGKKTYRLECSVSNDLINEIIQGSLYVEFYNVSSNSKIHHNGNFKIPIPSV